VSDGLPLIIAGPIGLAMSTAIGALWAERKAIRDNARDDCKERIAILETGLAHEQEERKREREENRLSLERLGARLDEVERERTTLAIRYAGAVSRIRADPEIPNDFADEAPTGVRALADLMAPKTAQTASDPHGLKRWDPYEKTPK